MFRFTWHGPELEQRWRRAAEAAALAMARLAVQRCREAVDVPYPPPSSPDFPPHRRTGQGQAAIVVRRDPTTLNSPTPSATLTLLESGVHLLYLEQGTERIAPRPWLVPTLVASHHELYETGSRVFSRLMQ